MSQANITKNIIPAATSQPRKHTSEFNEDHEKYPIYYKPANLGAKPMIIVLSHSILGNLLFSV